MPGPGLSQAEHLSKADLFKLISCPKKIDNEYALSSLKLFVRLFVVCHS